MNITSKQVRPGPSSPVVQRPAANPYGRAYVSDGGAAYFIVVLLIVANSLLAWAGKPHVPLYYVLYSSFVAVLALWSWYASMSRHRIRQLYRLNDEKKAVDAKLATALADLGKARVDLTTTANEKKAAEAKITSLTTQLFQAGEASSAGQAQTAARITQLESTIATQQAEMERLRQVNAEHERRERERTIWHTLPQGYDLDSETFAATIANALR